MKLHILKNRKLKKAEYFQMVYGGSRIGTLPGLVAPAHDVKTHIAKELLLSKLSKGCVVGFIGLEL